jgi:arylsulfatase A-like enzyme
MLDHQFSVYEPLMRVPLVVYFPPHVTPGREARPVMNLDLFPTILELAGIGLPGRSHGISLFRLRGQRPRLAEYPSPMMGPLHRVRESHPQFDPQPWDRSLRAYYDEPYKLIHASDGRHELYNLDEDPSELRNLMDDRPRLARNLTADLQACVDSLQKITPALQGQSVVDEDTRRRLELLGYTMGPGEPENRSDAPDSDDASEPDDQP